jgi:hypothetical protein
MHDKYGGRGFALARRVHGRDSLHDKFAWSKFAFTRWVHGRDSHA